MTSTKPKRDSSGSTSGSKAGRKFPVLGVVFAAVAILLVVAISFSGSDPIGSEYGDPTVEGAALPIFGGSTANDPALGEMAPELVGQNFDGQTVEIRHDGRPKAVVFLAHWCTHCQAEVPRVEAWLAATGGVDGVDMYSVATAMNSAQPNYPPSEWLERENWEVPVIRDDENRSALISYGAGGFPYWVFLNGDGTVAARSAGELPIDVLEGFLTTLAAGAPTG